MDQKTRSMVLIMESPMGENKIVSEYSNSDQDQAI